VAHGQQDYGMYAQKKTTYGLSDMGELAARLGSIVTFDRRGDVVSLEDFEYGITNWESVGTVGYTATWSAAESLSKGVSYKAVAPDGAATYALIRRYYSLPVNSRLGVEFAFLPDSKTEFVFVRSIIYDGTTYYQAKVYYSWDDSAIQYYNSAGARVDLATNVTLRRDGKCWHRLKMVIDLTTSKYVRCILDNVEYPMGDLGVQSGASATAPAIITELQHSVSAPGEAVTVHFDNVIWTQNEP